MKNSPIILISFLLLSVISFGQKLTDEEVKELEPGHYNTKLILRGVPAYGEMSSASSLGYGYGINLDGFILKRFSYSIGFSSSYSDEAYKNGNDPVWSDAYQGINKAGTFGANFNFHLLDKIGIGKIRVEKYKGVTSTGSGGMAHMYDVYKKKGPLRKIIAVRGGIYNWKSGVNPSDLDDVWYLNPLPSGSQEQATDRYYTNTRSSNFSLGLSSGKIVSGSSMGAAGVISYFRNFYADLLINLNTEMDNFRSSSGSESMFLIGQGTLTEKPIGWRAGWSWMGLGKKYWVGGYYFEGGVRPGIEGKGAYMQMGFILGTKYAKPLN